SLALLYEFTKVVGVAPRAQDVISAVLGQARDLLRGEEAELILMPSPDQDGAKRLSVGLEEAPHAQGGLAFHELDELLVRVAAHTGLPTRVLFHERVREALSAAKSHGQLVAVLLMDLDRFKEVNDSLGHHHGDRLLQELGARLVRSLDPSVTVARLGGDEFAVLLPRIARLEEAGQVAGLIRRALS